MPDALETARLALAAKLPEGGALIGAYTVDLEAMSDPGDTQRGAWVECWVTSPCGRYTNSLGLLEGEGGFDDGPQVSANMIDRLISFAQKHGY